MLQGSIELPDLQDNIEAVRAALEDDPDITAWRNPLP